MRSICSRQISIISVPINISFFQEYFEIPICKYIRVIKTTSPHEDNLRTERMRNSGTQLFCALLIVLAFTSPYFFQKSWTISYTWKSLYPYKFMFISLLTSSLLFLHPVRIELISTWLSEIRRFKYLASDLWPELSILWFCSDVLEAIFRYEWY